jgi:hypothetical protein
MRNQKTFFTLFLLFLSSTLSYSQKIIKGMVVDSVTLNSLQGVNVKIKHSNRGTSTNANGVFTIVANETDTLLFSIIGYTKAELPIYIEDETMFVRMHEESVLLKEIIVKDQGFHINQKFAKSPTLTTTKPLKASTSGGIGVNFSYFSKLEKEKRKLVKIMAENEKVKIYLDVVNDPDLKYEIMERHAITEEKFYELLALYNESHKDVMYSSNSGLILNSLLSYYENATGKK